MIETLFVRASFLARLLEPPLGSYLESLARRLQAQNYSLGVIRNYVYAALRFGEWLSKQGLALSAVSTQLVRRYIDQFEKRITPAHPYGQRPKLTQGLGHLLVVLRQEGVIVAPQQISSPTEQWLARYDQYLNQVGVKPRPLVRNICPTHDGSGSFASARKKPSGAACEPRILLDLSNKKPPVCNAT